MEICESCLTGLRGWCRQSGGDMECTEYVFGVNYDVQTDEIGLFTDIAAIALLPQVREITEQIVW